ncbi:MULTISPECIES: hypothetical protein [Paenibacillus]|nr:hypothetical protein [Paenibacillus odorifer]
MITERKSKLGVNDSGSVGVKAWRMITGRKSKLVGGALSAA